MEVFGHWDWRPILGTDFLNHPPFFCGDEQYWNKPPNTADKASTTAGSGASVHYKNTYFKGKPRRNVASLSEVQQVDPGVFAKKSRVRVRVMRDSA